MITSFKTKKIKGSPSGYFVTKEDLNSKKLKGFKNIGNTKDISKNEELLKSILQQRYHYNFQEYWNVCFLTGYSLNYLTLELSFFTLMVNAGISDMDAENFKEKYMNEYFKKQMAHSIDFRKITHDNFFVFIRE
jgi:hypothetical protein